MIWVFLYCAGIVAAAFYIYLEETKTKNIYLNEIVPWILLSILWPIFVFYIVGTIGNKVILFKKRNVKGDVDAVDVV